MDTALRTPWTDVAERAPIADRLAAELARRIAEGGIPGGSLLTEVEVASEHGVSRTPAREALLRLQSWGLVRLLPKKGALVTVPTVRERDELLAVRAMLERSAAANLGHDPERRDAVLAGLEDILRAQGEVLDDPVTFARLDLDFHLLIAGADGNSLVREMSALLTPRLARLTHLSVVSRTGRLSDFHGEHALLLDALRRGDADAFGRLLEHHLAGGHADYVVG